MVRTLYADDSSQHVGMVPPLDRKARLTALVVEAFPTTCPDPLRSDVKLSLPPRVPRLVTVYSAANTPWMTTLAARSTMSATVLSSCRRNGDVLLVMWVFLSCSPGLA